MVIKGEWLFWENLTSREKLEKWKCDENGLPEKNWKNEIATKMDFQKITGKWKCDENGQNCDEKEVERILKRKKKSFVRPRYKFAVKNILSFVDIEIEKLGKIKGVICGMCLRLVWSLMTRLEMPITSVKLAIHFGPQTALLDPPTVPKDPRKKGTT